MIVVFCAQIYRNRGWVYERKDLKHAETVLTVEHRGGHFPFTKVTSPLGSSAVRRVGSSPTTRTKMNTIRVSKFFIETRMVSYSESPAVQGFLLFLCIAYVYRETSKMRRCFYMPALLYEHGFLI